MSATGASVSHAGLPVGGSSSKKWGPVSSTTAGLAARPPGGVSGSPSAGAGRLVPGIQAVPFQ
ncbi:hypothetical protein ACWDO7_13510 [Streptomyces sp. NPDC003656]|uniref:hypothetical protein n=1 Tax=unclassified Streptomyces TaxID=2593676 RepID=UPI0027DC6053|nr:hypothetical protein [Streptomyces sp. DSM 110735]